MEASDCRAQNGTVSGTKGKKATYGELAEAASKLAVPKNVKLKDPKAFKYIGKPVLRLDTPSKVNGTRTCG